MALCTFNGARFIEVQLRSILTQHPPPHQIVVSDDGSTDGTVAIVEALFVDARAQGIKAVLLAGPREGVTANFAAAISACTGEIVLLSDQDDVWRDGRLADSMRTFEADPVVLLEHSDAYLVDEHGDPGGMTLFAALGVRASHLRAVRRGRAFSVYVRRNIATGATIAFRRELFERASPLPSQWLHDEWLAIVAAAMGRISVSDSKRIDYRQHERNQVGVHQPTLPYRIGRLLRAEPDRNARLARRSAVLRDRLTQMPVSPSIARIATAKARVEKLRAGMSERRARRVPMIFGLWVSGAYSRYTSQGSLEALRDIVR